MPLLEKYSDPVGSDLAKALLLWSARPEDLVNLEAAPADIPSGRFTVGINPVSREPAEVLEHWSNPGASTVPPYFMIQLLELHYVFRQRDEVIRFLEDHAFLVSLLLEARGKINLYFPEYPMVFLEVIIDPEIPEDIQLVASIRTSLSPDEALDRLDSLDKGWWLEWMDKAQGELCIHVEFA